MGPEFDVIIVGCGPAGATAGHLLAGSGHSVLMLDRATFPRTKLCGGLLSGKSTGILERLFGEPASMLKERGVIDYSSDHYEILAGSRSIYERKTDIPFHFVKRERYDHYILGHARKAGAEVREGDACIDFVQSQGEVVTASGDAFSARCVVGADGIHSTIRTRFPENKVDRDWWKMNLAAAIETHVDRDALPRYGDLDHPALFYGTIPWGYAWLFPNSDRIVVGMGGLAWKNRGMLEKRFAGFLGLIDLEPGRDAISGWVVPYGCGLADPTWGTTLLVGDAGGYADPFFGEGIYFAHRTGELAASAVHAWLEGGSAPGLAYKAAIREQVLPELTYGKLFRWFFFTSGVVTHPKLQQLILPLASPVLIDVIHGRRSYRWFRRK
ncbi:MAG: geranylgeranyl reductase family protein [Methanomicrobiaceae archaeon]|nr:geranylgeranyl reductase family protein [Methanomicrobiaceae archaeon]